jgi:hypothetical protein
MTQKISSTTAPSASTQKHAMTLEHSMSYRIDTPVRYAVDPWIATVTQG